MAARKDGRDAPAPGAAAPATCRPSAISTSRVRRFGLRAVRLLTTVALITVVGSSCLVRVLASAAPSGAAQTGVSSSDSGYWLAAADGGVLAYGNATFHGSTGGRTLNEPVVGMAATPDGKGYRLVAADGGIFNYGDANFYGSTGGRTLNKPVVGMAATPDGQGYWLVAADGGIFNYGDANFYGSTGGRTLNKPVVAMAATPDGKGYWLVAADGGIFNYGDAGFYGSTGGRTLNKPVVAMAVTPDGKGYWLVAADGGIFNYGDAGFYGSTGALAPYKPIVGIAATPDGGGYWLVAADGHVFTYGDATFDGSTGTLALNEPVVGMAAPRVFPASSTTAPPPTTTTTTAPAGGMAAPAGYSASQLVFDDQFSGTSLDTSNWFPGLDTGGPTGYGATGTTTHETYFSPSQVSVDNGLNLGLAYDPTYASLGWTTVGGCVTSKWSITGGYVQVRAKMPDASAGQWPAIWLVPTNQSDPPEIDMMEDGFLPDETGAPAGTSPNLDYAPNYHEPDGTTPLQFEPGANWWSTDLMQWNTYGMRVDPAAGTVKFYLNGNLIATQVGAVPDIPWTLILWNAFSTPTQSLYHTVGGTGSGLSGNNSMQIAEVQTYS